MAFTYASVMSSMDARFARAAWTGFIRAARAIAEQGVFNGFDDLVPLAELDNFMCTLEDPHA